MLAMRNTIRLLSARLASGRFVDLLSSRYHAPYLTRHRLSVIETRVKFIAAAFSVLMLIWIVLDAATLRANHWPVLATFRLLAAIVCIRLILVPDGGQSRARALTMLGIVLAMPLTIYGVSQFLLTGIPLAGLAAVNGNLYRALPWIVLAGVSVFPLVASEGLFFAVVIASAIAGIQLLIVGVNAVEGLSALWVFMLATGVYLFACTIQLSYMMALLHRANHDPLTGALTRHSGIEVLDLHFRLAWDRDAPISVLFVDVDDFKSINDNFGHDAGEQALKDIAAKLHALLRLADVVIRWGSEEFVLILPHTPINGARLVVGRLAGDPLGRRPDGAPVTASIGLAERQTDDATDWPLLIYLAEKRARAAKTSGAVA